MRYFVTPGSITRQIWGDADVILLIFAGSAAEFALNRAVDWLFFTGKLPADPIGRLFSTVTYAQEIIFADEAVALSAISRMGAIHGGVEQSRGAKIPDWAYRDVLYMLIAYSERAFETLHRPLTDAEREDVFQTFRRVGLGLHIPDLPATYTDWLPDRTRHLNQDLAHSAYTDKLFDRYRDALGTWRYDLLRQAMAVLVPAPVRVMLSLPETPLLASTIWLYGWLNRLGLRAVVQRVLLPTMYLQQIRGLDQAKIRRPAR